jgi:hypothetical protein
MIDKGSFLVDVLFASENNAPFLWERLKQKKLSSIPALISSFFTAATAQAQLLTQESACWPFFKKFFFYLMTKFTPKDMNVAAGGIPPPPPPP